MADNTAQVKQVILDAAMPPSVLTKKQRKTYGPRAIVYCGSRCSIVAEVRYDDQCGNGHNTFSITGEIRSAAGRYEAGGCLHEEIAIAFPELEPFIKWHLVSSDGPMHYLANTLYQAGDKDCFGGRKGEVRWYKYDLGVVNLADDSVKCIFEDRHAEPHTLLDKKEAEKIAERFAFRVVPVPWVYHEGKEPELESARSSAVWPDATLEQLQDKQALTERLPGLMLEFKAAMESLDFVY